mmetsp:Transcript_52587/g.125580  ORF Transcript_52587/g.125580 Transcript_52587/m.125580 type:complete len:167 (-) Transcript_52587:75-575(-)
MATAAARAGAAVGGTLARRRLRTILSGIHPARMSSSSAFQEVVDGLRKVPDSGAATIFDKIISKEIPASLVHEDELCLAFKDISPQAPTHILLIPKIRAGLTQISYSTPDHRMLLGHMMVEAGRIGRENCPEGFRLVVNDGGDGGQTVFHLHIHILGGRAMRWPPG